MWCFTFEKQKVHSDTPTRDNFYKRHQCMRLEVLRLCSPLIMTSIYCACEALPFKQLSKQHFVKMGSSPESTPAKRQKTKSLSHYTQTRASNLVEPKQKGLQDLVSPGHIQDELLLQEISQITQTVHNDCK